MNKSGTTVINPASHQEETVENDVAKVEPKATPGAEEINKLKDLVEDENKVLYEASSVFPFQLFPDKIIVHPTKIVVVHRSLFWKHMFPMLIRDINTVTVSRGLIFASIRFEIRSFEENPGLVTYMWPEHASRVESIVLGLISAIRDRGIDITKVPAKQARRVIRKLGDSNVQMEKML